MQISRIRLSDKTSRRLSRATPSAASEHHVELIGCPISMSFATFCVCLELRSLPSTRVTRFPRYYEPLRHPMRPGPSLAGVRLVIPDRAMGLPCCARFPCVRAAATTPVQRLGVVVAHLTQPYQPSPITLSGRPAHRPFRDPMRWWWRPAIWQNEVAHHPLWRRPCKLQLINL